MFELADLEKPDMIPENILSSRKTHSCYLASPFFSKKEVERIEALENLLDNLGISYFSPRKSVVLPKNASNEDRQRCFNENMENIENAKIVIAMIDGRESKKELPDAGTLVEIGAAYAFGVPIIGVKLKNDGEAVNIMLSQAFTSFCTTEEELIQTLKYGAIFHPEHDCE